MRSIARETDGLLPVSCRRLPEEILGLFVYRPFGECLKATILREVENVEPDCAGAWLDFWKRSSEEVDD